MERVSILPVPPTANQGEPKPFKSQLKRKLTFQSGKSIELADLFENDQLPRKGCFIFVRYCARQQLRHTLVQRLLLQRGQTVTRQGEVLGDQPGSRTETDGTETPRLVHKHRRTHSRGC